MRLFDQSLFTVTSRNTRYIDEIRRLGLQINSMDRSLRRRLASEKCLIGSRPSKSRRVKGDESDDETGSVEYSMLRSNEVTLMSFFPQCDSNSSIQLIIVDDMATYRLFRESSLWAAPQDDIIEAVGSSHHFHPCLLTVCP